MATYLVVEVVRRHLRSRSAFEARLSVRESLPLEDLPRQIAFRRDRPQNTWGNKTKKCVMSEKFANAGVHSNEDQIWAVKVGEYVGFYVDRRSWLIWSPVNSIALAIDHDLHRDIITNSPVSPRGGLRPCPENWYRHPLYTLVYGIVRKIDIATIYAVIHTGIGCNLHNRIGTLVEAAILANASKRVSMTKTTAAKAKTAVIAAAT